MEQRLLSVYDKEATEEFTLLKESLTACTRFIVVAGAGISTSAGIADFKDPSGLAQRFGGKLNLSEAVYHNNARLEAFHEFLREACVQASASNPTPFHHWVNALARDRRLVRLYTQNIDGLELRLPYLFTQTPLTTSGPWPNTIQLHGTLHYSQCTKNGHVLPTDLSLFVGNTPPVCRLCEIAEDERVAAGKRGRNPGGLRPRTLLYDQEADWENESIGKVHAHDLEAMPDALIVAGTALDGPGARDLVRSMAEVVRKNNGLAIWINKELPKQNVMACFDIVLKGTCDDFARLADMLGGENW